MSAVRIAGSNIPAVEFSSVTQSYPTLCDPMDRSTPGFPVLHQMTSINSWDATLYIFG